jgi:hypothetical protein
MSCKRRALRAIGLVVVLGSSPAVHATTYEIGGGVAGDFNAGADTLVELQFADGDTQEIKAGNGLSLFGSAGALFFDQYQHRLQTSLCLGVKLSTMQPTSNADLTFVRFPIELLAFYRNDNWHVRVGGGGVMHLGNSLTGSGAASNIDLDLDTAVGGVAQADFVYNEWSVGMRYTALSYRVSGAEGSAAANSIGVTLGYVYGFSNE